MKERRTYGLLVILLSLMMVFSFIALVDLDASSSEEARLGSALGEVLLNWKLMVLNGPSYVEGSGLGSSLSSLEESLEKLDAPASLAGRILPLKEKFERAKAEDMWSFQFGFWNFAQEDSTISLEGAEKGEDILVDKTEKSGSGSRRLGFRYLKFKDGNDSAIIQVGDRLNVPLSENFTIEFWVRTEKDSAEKVLASNGWVLTIADGQLVLSGPSGDRILTGGEVSLNSWTHLALTRDGEEVILYLNGTETGRATLSGKLSLTKEVVFGGGLIGDVDELRIKEKSVGRVYLNFDRPIDYMLGFPVLGWAQIEFSGEDLWRFYAGMLTSNISLKRESERYSVSGENLKQVANFLLKKEEGKRKIPSDLSSKVVEDLEDMRDIGLDDDITEEGEEVLDRVLEDLSKYLGLG